MEMTDLHIEEIKAERSAEWDDFVRVSPQGSLFATFAWKKILERGTSFIQRIFAIFRRDKLAGGVVLTEKKQLGRKVALNALLSPYLGFLLTPAASTKISERLSAEHEVLTDLALFLEKKYAQIDLINNVALTDVRPFLQRGWKAHARYTYCLDVSDTDKLWNGFDGSVRQAIKKAEGANLQHGIMECGAEEIFGLLQKTLTKKGDMNPIPKSLVGAIIEAGELENQRFIVGARNSHDRLVSAIVCVRDERRAYYLIVVNDPEYLSTGTSSLLIWDLAQHLSGISVRELDFIGGNIPAIARFKESFNPCLKTHFRLEHWTSPPFRVMKLAGRRLLGH